MKVEVEYSQLINIIFNEIDKDPGLFIGWQANIAMAMVDEYAVNKGQYVSCSDDDYMIHKLANAGAKIFINQLIRAKKNIRAGLKHRLILKQQIIEDDDSSN